MADKTGAQPSPHGEGKTGAGVGVGTIPASGVLYPATFIAKLWDIVSDSKNWDVVCWTEDGAAIRILDKRLFESRVLPTYFQHNKLISFVRQLNAYGFHKISDSADYVDFQHPIFRRNGYDNLKAIQRKKAERRRGKTTAGNTAENDDYWEYEQNPYGDSLVGPQSHIPEPYSEYDAPATMYQPTTLLNPARSSVLPIPNENPLESNLYQTTEYEPHYYGQPEISPKPQYQSKVQAQHNQSTVPTYTQPRQTTQSAMSVGSSPVDYNVQTKIPPPGRGPLVSQLPTINESSPNPQKTSNVTVPIQLLKGILNEVQDLKAGMQNVLLDVKRLQEQNQETQQYMLSILQEIFAPIPNSDTQNYLNLDGREYYQAGSGNAPSSGSFRSSGTRAPGPTLSLEASMGVFRQTPSNSRLMPSPGDITSTPFQQPYMSPYPLHNHNFRLPIYAQPLSSISDNMMTSPPTSDMLLAGDHLNQLSDQHNPMPNSDQL